MGRFILNSRDEVAGKFYINPVAERKYTRLKCAKVTLPNTITYAHPEEDLRFTTTHGGTTKDYIISLQGVNTSDANVWEDRLNDRIRQQGINDWVWNYDDNQGKFEINFTQNGTDRITFTKDCRILGITKGEVIAHVTYVGGKLEFTQQIGQSFPSTKNFVVEVADANENRKYYLSQDVGLLGKLQSKLTATDIQSVLNASVTSIPSTTGGLPWAVTWSVTAGVGDAVTYSMNWAAHPAGLSGNYLVSYYYTNNNGYPETSETGLGSLFATKNTGTALPDSLSALGTVAYNFSDPPQISTDYRKTLTIPATEHTQANMVTLINGLAIDGLTASATGTNQYTLSYTPRTTATLTQYITGVISIWADNTVAGFTQNFAYTLNPFPTAPATLVITLPTTPERTDTFVSNVVNLVPYNHAYITCNIVTQDCHASVGNEAVICEVPHAGAFMERHNYENNSEYYLPISRQDAVSGIEIGIIDDLGRDLKSRLRGATYLVVLEME
jgi:flagellar biosynthesis protein FliQ